MSDQLTCKVCLQTKTLSHFSHYKNLCKVCRRIKDKALCEKYRHTPHGRASRAWFRINQRSLNKDGKNPSYQNVEVRMTREQFIEWAIPAYKSWIALRPSEIPSVNRIDPLGHYEINNIELISNAENSKLAFHSKRTYTEITAVSYIEQKAKKHNLSLEKIITLLQQKKHHSVS